MTVTLNVWRVPPYQAPALLGRLVRERARLRRRHDVTFVKLLGTARDGRFGPSSVDVGRWALLVVGGSPPPADCRIDLRPLSSRGRWSGRQPFVPGAPRDGMVLALTRARLRPARALRFWRAAAAPGQAVGQAAGLLAAFGIGEAPLGWQGTVSVWRSAAHLVEFAYRQPAHRRVVDRSPGERWYAEELFARFSVVRVTGDRGVIGWAEEEVA